MLTNKYFLRDGGCISHTIYRDLIDLIRSDRLEWLIVNYNLNLDCSLRCELNTSFTIADIGHPQPGERVEATVLPSSVTNGYSYAESIQMIKDDCSCYRNKSKKPDRLYLGMCIKLLLKLKQFQKDLQESFYVKSDDTFWARSTHTFFLHGVVTEWIEKTDSLLLCGDYTLPNKKYIRPFHSMWRKNQKVVADLALAADTRGLPLISKDELCALNEIRDVTSSITTKTL